MDPVRIAKIFRKPSIKYLREFIWKHQLRDIDSISLHQEMFDDLALDYRHEFNDPMPDPLIVDGIWVKIDNSISTYNRAIITEEDDSAPSLRPPLNEDRILSGKVYECGYCHNLIDEFGYPLNLELKAKVREKFGSSITTAVCKVHERHPPRRSNEIPIIPQPV